MGELSDSKSSSPAVIDAQPMYPINRNLTATGLAALTQLDSLVLMEERDLMERLLGDSKNEQKLIAGSHDFLIFQFDLEIPCGPWGLTCGPPEKR